jgi:hypothetical protein
LGNYLSIPFFLLGIASYLIYLLGWAILGGVFIAILKLKYDAYLAKKI